MLDDYSNVPISAISKVIYLNINSYLMAASSSDPSLSEYTNILLTTSSISLLRKSPVALSIPHAIWQKVFPENDSPSGMWGQV